jgi:hypothetical protein
LIFTKIQKEVIFMKILFGTVEEMFAELKERNITEARLEPTVRCKTVGKDIAVPVFIHQIKVTALIEGMIAEVVLEYYTYSQITNEQVLKGKSSAFLKAQEIKAEIEAEAKEHSIKLKHGFFTETDECFIGSVKR